MDFGRFKKFLVFAVLVAVAAGVMRALPYAGGSLTPRSVAAAARGEAALAAVPGFGPAGWLDAAAARLWRTGGPRALAWGEFAAVAAAGTAGSLVILAVVAAALSAAPAFRRQGLVFGLAAAGVLAAAVPAAWRGLAGRTGAAADPRLIAAVDLSARVREGDRVFASPSAHRDFLLFPAAAKPTVTPAAAGALALQPTAWREALRQAGWTTVALAGPLGEYRPLLDHLLASPDWQLEAVTNHGYLFRRASSGAVPVPPPESVTLASPRETAIVLAQTAEKLDAVRRTGDATRYLTAALELAPQDPWVLAQAASVSSGRRKWQEALTYADRALAADSGFSHARLVRALALLELGQPFEAQQASSEVLATSPDDPYTLFLHARISRALNDYTREIETLEHLIAVSEKAGLVADFYRIYLGEAYARQGQAGPALRNYRQVLESGRLGEKQAAEIRDTISAIEQNAPPQ